MGLTYQSIQVVFPTAINLVHVVVVASILSLVLCLRPGRLRDFPGPWIAKLTSTWLYVHMYLGTEASMVRNLHLKHNSPVIRLAPNHISVSNQNNDPRDRNPVNEIYVDKGGLPKAFFYRNFDFDGYATIFSTLDHDYRTYRAKAVIPMFALGRVRASFEHANGACRPLINKFVARFQKHKLNALAMKQQQKLDLLDECRRLATDVTTAYTYGQVCGSLDEDGLLDSSYSQPKWSSSGRPPLTNIVWPFVGSLVSLGRFFLLPPRITLILASVTERLFPDEDRDVSIAYVNEYAKSLTENAKIGDDTFQARLLFDAKVSQAEVNVQIKDLILAGTDSTATPLATGCFHLIQRPDWLARLKSELLLNAGSEKPLLDATVKETFRIGAPNLTRINRVVPRHVHDFHILGHHCPPGTIIGCSSYCLHLDPEIFPRPFEFRPERWLDADEKSTTRMNASIITFGAGNRQCIARNLATQEVRAAIEALAKNEILEGMRTVNSTIEKIEWFNTVFKGDGRMDVWVPCDG